MKIPVLLFCGYVADISYSAIAPMSDSVTIIGDSLIPRNAVTSTIARFTGDWFKDLRGFDAVANKYFKTNFGDDGTNYLRKFSELPQLLNKIQNTSLGTAIANEARRIKVVYEGSWKEGKLKELRKFRSYAIFFVDIHCFFSILEFVLKNHTDGKIHGLVGRAIDSSNIAFIENVVGSWEGLGRDPRVKSFGEWEINAFRLISRATWGETKKLVFENLNQIVKIIDNTMRKRVRVSIAFRAFLSMKLRVLQQSMKSLKIILK